MNASRRIRRFKSRFRKSAGFTLIEAALTTVIVGTGVLAIVAAQQAYHMENDWAQRTGTALLLANELRELTLTLPIHDPITGKSNLGPETGEGTVADYDDLDDFAGTVDALGIGSGLSFNPPINALRQPVQEMADWTQTINVESVLPDDISSAFTQSLGADGTLKRVTVTVQYQGPNDNQAMSITSLTWVVTD